MRLRSIRARVLVLVIIPLLSLIGLYSFATALTASDAITLQRATAIRSSVNDPIGLLEGQIQMERLLATVYLANPTPLNLSVLTRQEAVTDRYLSALTATAKAPGTTDNSSAQVKAALAGLFRDTATIPALRQRIQSHTITISSEESAYGAMVAAGYKTLVQTVLEMPNAHLETQALAVMRVADGAEILLQEQSLFMGDVMTRSFSASAHQTFAQMVGEHRGLVAEAIPDLDPVYQRDFRQDVSPAATAALTTLENAVINTRAGVQPRVPVLAYEQASGAVAGGLDIAGYKAGLTLADYGHQVASPAYLRLILAGGLGLFAIIVSIIASLWIGRGLVRELGGLRKAALNLADVRLPWVVARLSSGEDVSEADGEVPFPNPTRDEIGQVRQAFNSVQRTAIEAAVGQARLRAGIATVFRNLSRRSQSLLHRQLAMLDDLELRAGRPEELEALFQIDHLTTRMRRNAEGLVVLAGDRPGRGWNRPVPLSDVLRAAVAEVEDYRRVKVITKAHVALAGRAVADVIHLIAELVENATIFSPPSTPVRVVGGLVGRGFAVEIEDRGLGITESTMAGLNAKLADPPPMDLAASDQLGLYVAARLAKQHGIRITLRDSPFGGTSAIVLIPNDLVVSEESYSADPDAGLANELAIQATGRHAVRRDSWVPPYSDHAEASLAEPGQEGLQDGTAPGVTVPEQAGPAEPFFPGMGGPVAADTMRPFFPSTPDEGAGQQNGKEEPQATADGWTERDLPRRVRQASLAPQLRDAQPQDAADTDGGSSGERSPSEARDAFTALQRGWERGRAESGDSWPGSTASPSDGSPWPGPDDNDGTVWPGTNGGTPWPGTSEQDGTP
jgi:signal transduction histidine kinase